MASTVGDYLFSKLVELGAVRVFGNGQNSSFRDSIYRNGLHYDDISVMYPTVSGLPVFVVSSQVEDLSACTIHGARYIGDGPAVYIVEQISAQFNNISTITPQFHFATAVVLDNPSTIAAQITAALGVMVREQKPIYIGVPWTVVNHQVPVQSASSYRPLNVSSGSGQESSAIAAIAMSFV